jgi:coenzyme F420-reducing hydrogenase beta subunit
MSNINNPGNHPCSSCGLCVVVCPHKAVDFGIDKDGFYKPVINEKCTDCGICVKVCYKYLESKNSFENAFKDKPVYAAWSKNRDTVLSSSSGGVGYELTNYFFRNGYKICGCVFDAPNDMNKHIIAENQNDLEAIKSSKYLQSYTVEAFSQFRKGEKYLVVGTPCQIYGLRKYIQLKKWEDSFILIDFFCHGTPSFNLWKKYKEYICEKFKLESKFESVNFRKKNLESTWHSYAMSIRDFSGRKFEKNRAFSDDLFFKFFLNNSCLNEACYQCKLRLDHCAADIRIADFWGKKYLQNDNGVNLVIVNTPQGNKVWNEIKDKLIIEESNYEDLEMSQPTRYLPFNLKREIILEELNNDKTLEKIYNQYLRISIVEKLRGYIKRALNKILKIV